MGSTFASARQENLVPAKYRALHKAVTRGLRRIAEIRDQWAHLQELRRKGGGSRYEKKLLGVKSRPMPEEVKRRLRTKNRTIYP